MGHVGDGNFHLLVPFDPNDAEEKARAQHLSERVARYVIDASFGELSQTIFLSSFPSQIMGGTWQKMQFTRTCKINTRNAAHKFST